MRIWLPISP